MKDNIINLKNLIFSIKYFIRILQYYIRYFTSKILDIVWHILSKDYVKTILVLLLAIFFAYHFGKRIAVGHLRTVIVFSIFFLLASSVVNLKSGITALIIFLPFMAFIRRYIYVYGRYVAMDPILIISDIITIWMFSYLIIFKGKEIFKLFRENKLVRFATILLLIFILQIFNPRQGSILVGIGGAKFYIIPLLWFYIGLFLDRRFIKRLLVLIVFIGVVTALYGLKQTFFGFTSFENYWIEYGGYSALHLFRIIRSFSTFASASEYAHYLTISGIICFAFFLKSRQKITYLVALGIIITALFISAVRSAIFAFVFSSILLVGFLVKDRRKSVFISSLLCLVVIMFICISDFTPETDIYNPLSVTTYHTMKGITNPMGESSFRFRLRIWTVAVPRLLIKNPFGYGLGSSTLAAWKFGSLLMKTESVFFDILISTGLAGAVIFVMFLFYVFSYSISFTKNNKENLLEILAIIIPVSFLFIGSASEYTIFPIIWLLWGVFGRQISKGKD